MLVVVIDSSRSSDSSNSSSSSSGGGSIVAMVANLAVGGNQMRCRQELNPSMVAVVATIIATTMK